MERHQLKNNMDLIKKKFTKLLVFTLLIFGSCSYSSSDYTEDLGNGYTFISESNSNQFISGPNDTTFVGVVPCSVEAFMHDDFYILARQKENSDCSGKDLSKISAKYWLIDKRMKTTYGPLDSLSYLKKRKELGVPNSLKFKD